MTQLFKLLNKYRPESRAQKRERLRALAEKKGKEDSGSSHKKPVIVKYGIHHVTSLVEQKKAQLVVIAHDVDPIEVCPLSNDLIVAEGLFLPFSPLDCSLASGPLPKDERPLLHSEREGKVQSSITGCMKPQLSPFLTYRLGKVVHKKTATTLALTSVRQ